jgi:hypothetical protein
MKKRVIPEKLRQGSFDFFSDLSFFEYPSTLHAATRALA